MLPETAIGKRIAQVSAPLAGLALAGCQGSIFDPLGPVGRDDATILIEATIIMLAIIIPTILLAFWMVWRYSAAKPKGEYLPYWSYSGRIEAVVWSIPILTIMFIGGVIWIGSIRLDPFRPLDSKMPPLEVQVVALDWKWLFIYPKEGVATVNRLVVPAGTPVHFSITSASVFNGFFIPRLGSMIYAMPGMVAQLNLQADRPADMFGQSTQFSGDGFSDMQFEVKSVTAKDYAAWLKSARAGGQALDRAAYIQLSRQSQNVKPYSYAKADPMLFDAVVRQQIPPGPGPEPENAAHAGREVSTGGKD